MSNILTWEYWEDIIEELDACPDLSKKAADFIISLMEKRPKYLSSRQVEWLEDLRRQFIF